MIFILHHNRYWTECLSFLTKNTQKFSLISSTQAVEGYNHIKMEVFDPNKHKIILTPGRLHEPTSQNMIIMRFLHSPGFFAYPVVRAYAELVTHHKNSDYRFLVLDDLYKALILREFESEAVEHFKYQMMEDPKIVRLKLNPTMHLIKEAPKLHTRSPGTGLLALTWLLVDNDFPRFLNICRTLRKELKINILLHPLMRMEEKILKQIQDLEGTLFERVYYNLTKEELIQIYDQNEYIISDGSGSCYEAMVRGCKPLAVRGLRCIPNNEVFNETLDEEYLPFPSYDEINKNIFFDTDIFLQKHFSYLYKYTKQEAEKIAENEILSLDILK
ncbi:MAG: hypothetical protein VX777_05680 [Chlamydiota bacterium]|nr:hypothetical protein [Chlamydiota bacterium]